MKSAQLIDMNHILTDLLICSCNFLCGMCPINVKMI